MIEILTFKLIIDLFDHLKVNIMELVGVQIYVYKKRTNTYQYYSFNTYNDLYAFFIERYSPFNLCTGFGDIWGVSRFTVNTELDTSYTMSLTANDVTGNFGVVDTSQFDAGRNSIWQTSKERQVAFLTHTLSEYNTYYNELYDIYLKGIYSVCYSEPSWTEHTTVLQSYKDLLFPEPNDDYGVYNNVVIE